VYKTDVFEGKINPGNKLKVSVGGIVTNENIPNNQQVIRFTISVSGGRKNSGQCPGSRKQHGLHGLIGLSVYLV
jgi:hypothetical protein